MTLKCMQINLKYTMYFHVIIHKCYFYCERRVRQGHPFLLSSSAFLRRSLAEAFPCSWIKEKLNPLLVLVSQRFPCPSHNLFVDNIMIFCRGNLRSLRNLINLIIRYAKASGQMVNHAKSKLFSSSMYEFRTHHTATLLAFRICSLSLSYLGVPIFKGAPKATYF